MNYVYTSGDTQVSEGKYCFSVATFLGQRGMQFRKQGETRSNPWAFFADLGATNG
jgi:hypothetical protein